MNTRPTLRRHRSRGVGLIDALIALAILCFGLLAVTRLQSRMVTSTTDAQLRQSAVQLADELLNTAIVDVANAACYTLPQSGTCANAGAKTRTTEWSTRVTTALPGSTTPHRDAERRHRPDDRRPGLDRARFFRSPTTAGGDRCAPMTNAPLAKPVVPGTSAACRSSS
jgi:type II secretory pathway pseudopilin PulG